MFRKKEPDPARAGTIAERPVELSLRGPLEMRGPLPPDLPRRPPIEPPTAPLAAVTAGPGEAQAARPAADEAAGKRLIVGHGISLAGEISACERLVVEGNVQVTLNQTRIIEITESGRFTNGKAEVEEAEISGLYEGELTVQGRLLIRSTGCVKGTVRCGELEVQRGGRLSGTVSMLEPATASGPPAREGDGPDGDARGDPRPEA